ncbi:restriction endonuclease subunit S [Desulfovibrio aminophilus]|nr:restriction endonuclease subunit S [Desulfovibrio aminophilus]MCM0754180.1 restriction endonuclease subunit S [Desulfovibrio aminophilus]
MSEKPIISIDQDSLPASWVKAQFSAVCSYIQRGKSPQYDDNTRFPILNQKCIRWDTLQYEHLKFIAESQWNSLDSLRFVQDGDILWNSTGTGTIGRACHYWGQHQFPRVVVDSHVTIVRASAHISSRYLYYYIRSPFVQQKIADLQTGSTNQVELGKQAICDSEVPLPPSAEQARIVSRVEELFSDLDKGEESLRRAQAQLKRYRQSVLKAAVTGELTRAWREQNADKLESGEALLKRILKARREAWEQAELEKLRAKGKRPKDNAWKARYVEPQGPDTEGLPELPQGWAWANVEQVSSMIQYGSSAKTGDDPTGIPVLRMGNIRQDGGLLLDDLKYLPRSHDEFPALLLEVGDLLFNRTNSAELVGKTGYYEGRPSPCSFASYLIRVRSVRGVNSKFLSYCLNSAFGRAWVKEVVNQTVGQANVNGTKLAAFTFPLPPELEQNRVVEQVEELAVLMGSLERDLDLAAKKLKALRQSILKAAFSGKLVPQEPKDEPASELLQRIAAERAAQGARPARNAAPRAPRKARAAAQPSAPAPAAPSVAVSGLAAARKVAGLSQAQLAAAIGINQAYVSQMETGKRAMTADQAAAIAKALGVEPSVLTQE